MSDRVDDPDVLPDLSPADEPLRTLSIFFARLLDDREDGTDSLTDEEVQIARDAFMVVQYADALRTCQFTVDDFWNEIRRFEGDDTPAQAG